MESIHKLASAASIAMGKIIGLHMVQYPDVVLDPTIFRSALTEELVAFTDLKDKSPGANILSEIDLAGMAALAAADEWNHLHKIHVVDKEWFRHAMECVLRHAAKLGSVSISPIAPAPVLRKRAISEVSASGTETETDNDKEVHGDSDDHASEENGGNRVGGRAGHVQVVKRTTKKESAPWTDDEDQLLMDLLAKRMTYPVIHRQHIKTHTIKALQIRKGRLVKDAKWVSIYTTARALHDAQKTKTAPRQKRQKLKTGETK